MCSERFEFAQEFLFDVDTCGPASGGDREVDEMVRVHEVNVHARVNGGEEGQLADDGGQLPDTGVLRVFSQGPQVTPDAPKTLGGDGD